MALKKLPKLHHFKCAGNSYTSQAIVKENTGNDFWTVNVKIWRKPNEKTWSYGYATGNLVSPKGGQVYEAAEVVSSGHEKVGAAYQALQADLEARYA